MAGLRINLLLQFCVFLISLQTKLEVVQGSVYSFCSEGTTFTFSTEACPGGVLLKKALIIDEPCHCFESDLMIYSLCGGGRQLKKKATKDGCEMPLISDGDNWGGRGMLFIPADFKSARKGDREHCDEMPEYCSNNESIALSKPKMLEKLFLSENKKDKTNLTSAAVTTSDKEEDEKDSNSNESSEEKSSSSSEEKASTVRPTKVDQPRKSKIENKNEPSNHHSSPTIQPKKATFDPAKPVKKTNNNSSSTKIINRAMTPVETIEKPVKEQPTVEAHSRTIATEDVQSSGIKQPTPEEENKIKISEEERLALEAMEQENKAIMRHITGVKTGQIPRPPPNTMTFKMIKQSVQIVARAIPNKIIKDINLEEAYLAFSYLFSNIDEDQKTDKNLNHEDYNSIMLALENCYKNVFELSFKTSGRPRQIKQYYLLKEYGFTAINPQLPIDRAHQNDLEDYVVGIMWKVIDMTHTACFSQFKEISPSTEFDYLISIENVFQRPEVQKRWYQPQHRSNGSETTLEFISHPNLIVFMDNLDKIDAAMHNFLGLKDFLKKPKSVSTSRSLQTEAESGRIMQLNDMTQSEISGDTKIKKSSERKKRESVNEQDFSVYEIWGGRAYCLQKTNPKLAAGISNSEPSLKKLCTQIALGNRKG